MEVVGVWNRVKWTEAAQVWAAMELGDGVPPPAGVSPRDYWAERRAAGDLE